MSILTANPFAPCCPHWRHWSLERHPRAKRNPAGPRTDEPGLFPIHPRAANPAALHLRACHLYLWRTANGDATDEGSPPSAWTESTRGTNQSIKAAHKDAHARTGNQTHATLIAMLRRQTGATIGGGQ